MAAGALAGLAFAEVGRFRSGLAGQFDKAPFQNNRDRFFGLARLSSADGQKILDELTQLNVELDKISGQSANTLAGNLLTQVTTLDGWINLGNNVGGLISSASGVCRCNSTLPAPKAVWGNM